MVNIHDFFRNQLFIFLASLFSLSVQAQDTPFNCDYNAYLFQYNDVYAIDLASGNAYVVATDVTPGSINAAAYNPADGYIWGSLSSPEKTIVRIGNDFQTTTFYVDELPTNNRYVGDINANGIYFLKGGGTTYYKIDLNPESNNYGQHNSTETLSQNINIHDWAFNAVDNYLYAVEKGTNILYRIDPNTSNVLTLGEVPILSGLNYTYGAVYFDASGRFYVSANQTGTIYVIQNVQDLNGTTTIESNLFAFGPSSSSNDGARCPTAPVPQEICDNGIDDDGDGLVDCEDPSCSGFGDCAIIDAPTTANLGGLESNGRLSEAINKRNYSRAKTSYKFDQKSARRVVKNSDDFSYRVANNSYQLQDFIPLDLINEDYAVESTPSDLISITNATDVYSVDYMQNDASIASILALRTENGVYEHTKYICDRLLGAELISVSTIEINEQSFIKAIIKNIDGSYEYVLSLSAKAINNDTDFAIESHWNLDLYETDVPFYNFQIWSNSIDDLYILAEGVLNQIQTVKPISNYNITAPPTVFVRKGKYTNGMLDLEIINTNATNGVIFDAGFRPTETSDFNYTSSNINLNQNYITNVEMETGNLFDIGFRIGDGIHIPDDLFMSDGPWGIDDSENTTEVFDYTITPNEDEFDTDVFPIERNLVLTATTSTYVSAYRALTPRFQAVDLSSFNSFNFQGRGTGNIEITLVKESIYGWEAQHRTTIELTEDFQEFHIPISNFISSNSTDLVLDDIVTIVFTMASHDGSQVNKTMNINNVSFSNQNPLSTEDYEIRSQSNNILAYPNPITDVATLRFTSEVTEQAELIIYNQIGKQVYKKIFQARQGLNELNFSRNNLGSGLYVCTIISQNSNYYPLKLLLK